MKQILSKILTAVEHIAESIPFRTEDSKNTVSTVLADVRKDIDGLAELDTPAAPDPTPAAVQPGTTTVASDSVPAAPTTAASGADAPAVTQ